MRVKRKIIMDLHCLYNVLLPCGSIYTRYFCYYYATNDIYFGIKMYDSHLRYVCLLSVRIDRLHKKFNGFFVVVMIFIFDSYDVARE